MCATYRNRFFPGSTCSRTWNKRKSTDRSRKFDLKGIFFSKIMRYLRIKRGDQRESFIEGCSSLKFCWFQRDLCESFRDERVKWDVVGHERVKEQRSFGNRPFVWSLEERVAGAERIKNRWHATDKKVERLWRKVETENSREGERTLVSKIYYCSWIIERCTLYPVGSFAYSNSIRVDSILAGIIVS